MVTTNETAKGCAPHRCVQGCVGPEAAVPMTGHAHCSWCYEYCVGAVYLSGDRLAQWPEPPAR
jgi:hypothetical protein